MSDEVVSKAAVSVTEMARAVGLSRARFYQLVRRGTFPPPDKEPVTGRPCYFEDGQRRCLEVRRRNCGIDGKPILFYSRRRDLGQTKAVPRPMKPKVTSGKYGDVIDYLQQANITMTMAQVDTILKELFPNGTDGIDIAAIVEAIIERTHRQNRPGSA